MSILRSTANNDDDLAVAWIVDNDQLANAVLSVGGCKIEHPVMRLVSWSRTKSSSVLCLILDEWPLAIENKTEHVFLLFKCRRAVSALCESIIDVWMHEVAAFFDDEWNTSLCSVGKIIARFTWIRSCIRNSSHCRESPLGEVWHHRKSPRLAESLKELQSSISFSLSLARIKQGDASWSDALFSFISRLLTMKRTCAVPANRSESFRWRVLVFF